MGLLQTILPCIRDPKVNRMINRISAFLPASVLLIFFWGCTTSVSQKSSSISKSILPPSTLKQQEDYWWSVRFKVTWPRDNPPLWPVDLLLAHRIVEPVLAEFNKSIRFWRFHRRAARDVTGHQFSFMFYAPGSVAGDIYGSIRKNRILEKLLSEKLIEHIKFDDSPRYPDIENRSDPNWSLTLQKAWPAYIMGVSAMWLELINLHVKDLESTDINDMFERYQKINESIDNIWIHEGQHALLHHLNAIFGYEPLVIKKRMGF